MLVLLPSGSIFGLNVKVITFVLLLPVAAQTSFALGQLTLGRLVLMLSVLVILILWSLESQIYGFDSAQAAAQFKDLFVTVCTCWFGAVLCDTGLESSTFLLRAILFSEVFASTIKIAMLSYAFSHGIPVSTLIGWIHSIFGVQLMPFDFEMAFGRIQFISDNLIPVCMFAVLAFRTRLKLNAKQALFALTMLTLSDIFCFSRYLWVFSAMAIVLGLVVGKWDRFQAGFLALITAAVLAALPFVVTIVLLRFSSAVVSTSDADRVQQIVALRSFFSEAPWFGHGLGSYSHRVIRSPEAPYSYEAQLLALLGQVGLAGVALLIALLSRYYRRAAHLAKESVALLLLLAGWLAGGLFNPSVISSAASVSYVAILAMTHLSRDESAAVLAGNR